MDRRTFLQGLATLGAISPLAALAGQPASVDPISPDWALGFRSMDTDRLFTAQLALQGAVPKALRGVLYRNGPARHQRGDLRYRHWFDGDGMVHSYRFTDSGICHLGQYVHTEKYVAEQQAGRFLRPAFGTIIAGAAPQAGPDGMNTANISVLHHADELLALWEGGSAHRMHATTLATLGKKTWREDLAGVPFSAHPKVEADGTLWNFGALEHQDLLVLYRISATGKLQKADAVSVPQLSMIHDFALTEKHLIFLLPPFRLNQEQLASGKSRAESYAWHPNRSMRVLTIQKDDWSQRRLYETEPGFVFHFGNAWEDRQGVIRLSYLRSDNDAAFRLGFDVMQGAYQHSAGAQISLMKIDPQSKQVDQEKLSAAAEFPAIDPRYLGQRSRQLVTIGCSAAKSGFGFDQVQRHDLESGTVDRYHYGDNILIEEHLLVPDFSRQAEGHGWVIGTALDLQKKVSMLSVFDAMALQHGPIAQAYLPYALPLGLHGSFRQQCR